MEENTKAKAAKARTKAQNDSVVVKGKGKAAVVGGESSKSAKQKGKEVTYSTISSYFAFSHILTVYIEAHSGRSDSKGRE